MIMVISCSLLCQRFMSFTVNLLTSIFPLRGTKPPTSFVFPDGTTAGLNQSSWVLSKAEASVQPLLSPSWSLNFNGTLILCWNYSFWVSEKPEKNMEQNKNESWQQTGIIILGLFLIGFQGIYNTFQSLVSFCVLQQHSSSIMRLQQGGGQPFPLTLPLRRSCGWT